MIDEFFNNLQQNNQLLRVESKRTNPFKKDVWVGSFCVL